MIQELLPKLYALRDWVRDGFLDDRGFSTTAGICYNLGRSNRNTVEVIRFLRPHFVALGYGDSVYPIGDDTRKVRQFPGYSMWVEDLLEKRVKLLNELIHRFETLLIEQDN